MGASTMRSAGANVRIRSRTACILFVLSAILLAAPRPADAATEAQRAAAAGLAAAWLTAQQNPDGSWGARDIDKLLNTAETVQAMRSLNLTGPAYVRGIAWLENHHAPNSDLSARRVAALIAHGDSVATERTALTAAYSGTAPVGWGLTGAYASDPLDTALVMLTLRTNNPAFYAVYSSAIDALVNSSSASTWTIGQPTSALAFPGDLQTTVAVAANLRACAAIGLPSCTNLASLFTALESKLVAYTYTTVLERALIAGYFAGLRATPPIPLANIAGMIDLLILNQAVDGSFDADVLTTATALRALTRWLGYEDPTAFDNMTIANASLRASVNRSLGQHEMDMVTRGDLWRLTTLDLSYASTGTSLAQLAAAQNLKTIDVSGNPCLLTGNVDATIRAVFPNVTTIIKYPVGDVSRDDAVNAHDARLIVADVMERQTLSGITRRAADLNFDGQIDARDIYWMQRIELKRDVSALCQ